MPHVTVFAGPNGSGKSTVTSKFEFCENYVNADSIQRHLKCTELEAARIAESTREYYLSKNENFTFETVLSTTRNIDLLKRAKDNGYHIACIYVLTRDPAINIERVKYRASIGGHNVPSHKVYTRYCKALSLLPELFSICDELYVFDNSCNKNAGEPSMILSCIHGIMEKYPNTVWNKNMIDSLVRGTYPEDYFSEDSK